MDEFMKNLSSEAPIKPSEIPRLSSTSDLKQRIKEINENDQDFHHHHHQMGSKFQNSKKSSMAKNFMSPTVSASSKATTPRKKILVERNEASGTIFPDTHLPKRTTHASADLISSPITKLSPRVSEMEDTGNDSMSQPYDPLTNYLSPRPKFLRYNPNRRLEILFRRESEMEEGKENGLSATDASSESEKMVEEEVPSDADGDASSSSSSSEEGSIKPEDGSSFGLNELGLNPPPEREETHENGNEEDEEIDEVEEEGKGKHGYLNQVMKFLLLLLVLTISTLYVSSMNSPTPPPALQALRDYKDEYLKIQESFIVWGTTFFDQMQENNQYLLMEAIERDNDKGVDKEEVAEEEWEEEVSDQVDEMLELGEREKEEDFLEEIESVKEEEGTQKEEMIVEELEEKSVEVSDQMEEFIELNEGETEEISEILQVSEKEVILVEVLEAESTYLNEGEEMVEDELEKTGDVTDESHDSMELQGIEETSVISETLEEDLPQTQYSIGTDTPSISEPEVTSSEEEEDTEHMKIELIEKWGIGITIISVVLAYIIVRFLRIYRRRKPSAKDKSMTIKKPSFGYAAKEKNGGSTQVLLKKEETNTERIEKAAESYVNPPCSSILSGVKDYKEISRIQAPTVELLGEYVVEELNSSFKSCSLKPKTVECEESIFSVSLDQKPRRRAFSSPVNQEYPSLSEFSGTNSPSYRSFTAREKIGRKKEVRDGEEAVQMVTTPVRRSSRLRSKSVTSP